MTLPSSGALSLNDVRGEFGGPSSNVAVNSYYRSGSFVYNVTKNLGIPTSGTIAFDDFYGTEGAGPYAKGTCGSASTGGKASVTYSGVDTVGQATSTFGSWADASVTVGSTARTVRTFMSSTSGGPRFWDFDFNVSGAVMSGNFFQVFSTSALLVDCECTGSTQSGTRESASSAIGSGITYGPSSPVLAGMPNSGTVLVQCNKGSFT